MLSEWFVGFLASLGWLSLYTAEAIEGMLTSRQSEDSKSGAPRKAEGFLVLQMGMGRRGPANSKSLTP
jgi:hypothetical protein